VGLIAAEALPVPSRTHAKYLSNFSFSYYSRGNISLQMPISSAATARNRLV